MIYEITIYLPSNLNKIFRMKKLVLFAAILALGVTSCSKDDDDNKQAELVGKWEYAQEGSYIMGQEFLTAYQHAAGCTKDFMVLTASTVVEHNFDGPQCTEDIYTDTYTRNGNTLTLMIDGEAQLAEIVQLDNSTLKIKTTETFEGQTIGFVTVYTRK